MLSLGVSRRHLSVYHLQYTSKYNTVTQNASCKPRPPPRSGPSHCPTTWANSSYKRLGIRHEYVTPFLAALTYKHRSRYRDICKWTPGAAMPPSRPGSYSALLLVPSQSPRPSPLQSQSGLEQRAPPPSPATILKPPARKQALPPNHSQITYQADRPSHPKPCTHRHVAQHIPSLPTLNSPSAYVRARLPEVYK